MRLIIFMFFFIMYAQVLLLFQTWYNNIFSADVLKKTPALSLTL